MVDLSQQHQQPHPPRVRVIINEIPTGRANALVAQSDLEAAVAALQQHFHHNNKSNNNNIHEISTDAAAAADADNTASSIISQSIIQQQFLQQACSRLVDSMYQVSQVIPDKLYNEYVQQHCPKYFMENDVHNNNENDLHDNRESDSDSDESDNQHPHPHVWEFDAHELLDTAAEDKVASLQQLVQEKAQHILTLRKKVVQEAQSLALLAVDASSSTTTVTTSLSTGNDASNDASSTTNTPFLQSVEPVSLAMQRQATDLRRMLDDLQQHVHQTEEELALQLGLLQSALNSSSSSSSWKENHHHGQERSSNNNNGGAKVTVPTVDSIMRMDYTTIMDNNEDPLESLPPEDQVQVWLRNG